MYVQSTVMKLLICHWIIEYMAVNQSLWQYMILITYTLCQKYCMYVHTCTLITLVNRRDNFHYVSKSIDWKLCNYLQYVDIVLITVCLYQVGRVHNTQLIFMSAFLLCLCQCTCFQYILCYPFCSTVTYIWW